MALYNKFFLVTRKDDRNPNESSGVDDIKSFFSLSLTIGQK
jgi:hypothetical protein